MADNTKKVARFHFPKEMFLKPANPHDSDHSKAPPTESVVLDTHFANLFREWMAKNRVGYDPTVHEALQQIMQEYIEKNAAVRMVMQDIEKSGPATGVGLRIETKTITLHADKMLELALTKELVIALGLSEYTDDIMSIEINKTFGQGVVLAKKKQQQQRDDAEWMRKTASGIHNMVRDIAGSLKRSKFQPDPVSPSTKAKAKTQILQQIREEAPEASAPGVIPGPS